VRHAAGTFLTLEKLFKIHMQHSFIFNEWIYLCSSGNPALLADSL